MKYPCYYAVAINSIAQVLLLSQYFVNHMQYLFKNIIFCSELLFTCMYVEVRVELYLHAVSHRGGMFSRLSAPSIFVSWNWGRMGNLLCGDYET